VRRLVVRSSGTRQPLQELLSGEPIGQRRSAETKLDIKYTPVDVLLAMGKAHLARGDRVNAKKCWLEARELFKRVEAPQVAEVTALINEVSAS
jgi:hypothetical protein